MDLSSIQHAMKTAGWIKVEKMVKIRP